MAFYSQFYVPEEGARDLITHDLYIDAGDST
jgi:hypothetical protein